MDADCAEADGFAFVFELFEIDLQVFGGDLICKDFDGQLVDAFEICFHSEEILGETDQFIH